MGVCYGTLCGSGDGLIQLAEIGLGTKIQCKTEKKRERCYVVAIRPGKESLHDRVRAAGERRALTTECYSRVEE